MYLCVIMSQQHSNHLMLLQAHKTQTNTLSLVNVTNNFMSGHVHRKNVCGSENKPSDLVQL